MPMSLNPMAELPRRTWFHGVCLTLTALLLCVRNLPWQLNDYDQAKQAFVAYEIVHAGRWFFQHMPGQKDMATKPPLLGWISAGLYLASGSWNLAWRLPSLAAALALMALLYRAGERWLRGGGLVAACALALNIMGVRLATLVRTDMLLTLVIGAAGLLSYDHIRRRAPWDLESQCALFVLIAVSMMIKGPMIYALLLPGVLLYALSARRLGWPSGAWGGWWPWLLPWAVFLLWVSVGVIREPAFYNRVIVREFAGRFTTGDQAVHQVQPLFFYMAHLCIKWIPWAWFMVSCLAWRSVRTGFIERPEMAWLACWALGGLLVMSLVPDKRVDRIFPLIPPLCLLLPAMLAAIPTTEGKRHSATATALILALTLIGGYVISQVVLDFQQQRHALAVFGRNVRQYAREHNFNYVTLTGHEGLLLYTDQLRSTEMPEIQRLWEERRVQALVLGSYHIEAFAHFLGPYTIVFRAHDAMNDDDFFFIERKQTTQE